MPRSARVTATLALGPATLAVVMIAGMVAGCAKEKPAARPGATRVAIELTDDGCTASPASIPAGPATFEVTNRNATKVTEVELIQGEQIMAEKENLAPGLSGTFSLNLKPGRYQLYCPNAKTEKTDVTVTGTAVEGSLDPAVAGALADATSGYQKFVIAEVDKLIPATKTFTDAVRAGNLDAAKAAFAPARYHYEEIEPVAESFGDLDPGIDARADNVENPAQWTGFHRIEKALWADRSLAGMAPIADRLDADVAKLKTLVATATYQPAQLANGATELLNEVATSKITGEEDRYSHTDLSDFEANVLGGKAAIDLLMPVLARLDASLASTVDQRFTDVLDSLKPYKKGDAFVDYSTVTEDQRRALTQKVDALAEPLSQIAAKVTV
jgi:iron uptake system component EfeO